MDLKEFDFNKLETKQKVMLGVGVVLAVFVIWQVFSMFGGGSEPVNPNPSAPPMPPPGMARPGGPAGSPVPPGAGVQPGGGPGAAGAPASSMQPGGPAAGAAMPVGMQPGGPGAVAGMQPGMGQSGVVTPSLEEVKPLPASPEELAELENTKQMRKVYLTLLQQYQIAGVQRLLAETRANIASSEATLAKNKLEKERSEAQAEQVSSGGKVGATGEFTPGAPLATTDDGPSDKYSVTYIGQQRGQWSAILMYEGKPVDVTVGSRLGDDSEVMSINSQTVLLAKNMKRRLIHLPATSMTLLKAPAGGLAGQGEDSSSDQLETATSGTAK